MTQHKSELLRGTLDLLILKVLASGAAHGYAITGRIRERSEGALSIEEGTLYPALHRLERKRLLASEWGVSEANRRAKFYRLSSAGRRELTRRETTWNEVATAIGRVLRPASMGWLLGSARAHDRGGAA